MKNAKKLIFLLIVLCCIHVQAFAQLAVKVGTNLSNIRWESLEKEGLFSSIEDKAGFDLGLTYDFGKRLVFQPGIFFSQKHYVINMSQLAEPVKIDYVEIPCNLLLKMGKSVQFYLGAGAVLSTGIRQETPDGRDHISAKMEFEIYRNGEKQTISLNRSFDLAFQAVTGFQINRFTINFNYNFSLVSRFLSDPHALHEGCGVNVGFQLRRK